MPHGPNQRRDPEQRPSPEALLEAARREDSRAGRLKIFVGAAPGVGKTYEMLQSAHAKVKAGADVVVGVVETHGRAETEALLQGLEVLPRKRIAYKDQVARGDGSRRADRAPSADRAGRRTCPHQRARQPPSQALSRRRGTAFPRHRRLYRGQYPAYREPQRRGRADHACAGARDRAGFGVRPRRRHRTDRSHARRPDPAAEGGQGLRPQTGRARAGALFLAGQSDRAARTGAAANRRAGRRAVAHPYAGQRHRRPLGRGRAHPGLRQRGSAGGGAGALHQAAGGPAARALDRHQHRDAAQPATDRRAARPARRHAAAGGSAGRRGAHHSRRRTPYRRRCHRLRAGQQRDPDHHRQVDALAGGSKCMRGSVVHDLVRRAGNISVNVIAGEELAAEPVPKKTVRTAERPEPFDPVPYPYAAAVRRHRAWRRLADPSAIAASKTSTSCF